MISEGATRAQGTKAQGVYWFAGAIGITEANLSPSPPPWAVVSEAPGVYAMISVGGLGGVPQRGTPARNPVKMSCGVNVPLW
jgi:hypothetical protein